MQDQDGEIHVETDEARGGSTPHIVRWVLGIGLLLAVVGMSLAWIIPALSRSGETRNANVSREIVTGQRRDGSSTDSIVGEQADKIDAPHSADTASDGQPTVANSAR
ncbi:MAG: hypothetical protein ABIT09_02445 [Croceibacterium sp.]